MRNDEAKTLQTLLSQDKYIYPEALTTGYFGRTLTRKAVQRFQCKHNIICEGDEAVSEAYGEIEEEKATKTNI
ncbi:MAG: hypothetical protein IIB81_02040 [Nanoarchaeota archaeon]|nr:hypothetical protein [Nanoarchaeota archaeon]